MVDELLAARRIVASHEAVRQWELKFGQDFANQIRHRLPAAGDKGQMDEVVLTIAGVKHWLWRLVDQNGMRLDALEQVAGAIGVLDGGRLRNHAERWPLRIHGDVALTPAGFLRGAVAARSPRWPWFSRSACR